MKQVKKWKLNFELKEVHWAVFTLYGMSYHDRQKKEKQKLFHFPADTQQ